MVVGTFLSGGRLPCAPGSSEGVVVVGGVVRGVAGGGGGRLSGGHVGGVG